MFDRIEGLWAALATPLRVDGGVDHSLLARHAVGLIAQGCDGVVLFGTTGEGPSFSAQERIAAVEALMAAGIPAARLSLGTGFPAIPDSIALTRTMLSLGLTHALLLPPYFFRDVSAKGLEAAFSAIIDGVNDPRLRVTLYHIPQVSGVAIPPGVLAALRARHGSVVAGLKDSSGDYSHFSAFRAACPEAAVVIGNEVDIGRALADGGTGTICGMVNVVPHLVRRMFTAPDAPIAMKRALAPMTGPFVPTLKAALASLTGEPGWLRVRAPLLPLAADDARRVGDVFRDLLATEPA